MPTFPNWHTDRREYRVDQAARQAFSVLSGVVGRARRWNMADRPAKPPCCAPAVVFFSAADRPDVPLSFELNVDRRHAHDGGARRRRMAARMARTIGPVTATSASWKVMARACRTTRAPIFISFCCRPVNDQLAIASGNSMQRRKVARL